MPKPILIGLCGRKTAGKDELADALVRRHGYVKFNCSDPLLEASLAIRPQPRLKTKWWLPRTPLNKIVAKWGYVKAKEFPEVRKFLQHFGTEVGRQCIHDDVWVSALEPRIRKALIDGKNVVVSGCRYDNEAKCINRLGGYVVLVSRPGNTVDFSHSSEHGYADKYAIWEVVNDGSLDDLAERASWLHRELSLDVEVPTRLTHDIMTQRYHHHREIAVQRAIRWIFECASPDPGQVEDFVRRNRTETLRHDQDEFNQEIVIEVNGEEAGVITCEENVVVAACNIAR